jgi:hypothetical protein
MSYIATHRSKLERRHYITTARRNNYWHNFYALKLSKYCRQYGHDFCLVINGSTKADDAYVLPFKEVKKCYSKQYLNGNRWIGIIEDIYLIVSRDGAPVQKFCVTEFHNAFELLQEAPTPLPNIDEFI